MKTPTGNYNLPQIIQQFRISGSIQTVLPYGSGHIHDTFRLQNTDTLQPDYLLQRINHQVFRQVPELMSNMERVIEHIRQKLHAIPGADISRQVLTLVPIHDGKNYLEQDGNYWRVFLFIKNARSYDQVQTTQQAYQAGKAFGKFQSFLADMPVGSMHETIPDFHNVKHRLNQFQQAIDENRAKRLDQVQEEVAFVRQRAEEMKEILRLGQAGKIPLRITHNDTKFNNVLLDENDQALCVIDLDTIMPGYAAYDFGDSIRTIASTAAEDEKDLSKIEFNLPFYKAYVKGYLEETHLFLNEEEIKSLAFGCKLLTFLMGLRFLTDYINGDVYYKIHFPEHNLQRSRAQFRLLSRMELKYTDMQDIVQSLINDQ
ncbi:aminoglycoside phosphotransferase family protein [Rhodocytophaga rosea]|uniref:Aminoglycoside phosphotransferase family protein n=1 Tax=Rhodocytophaga rosea TaxID=2704465 RepID=A0A6C0GHK3_9BACT|nr:aminoglycoside phosphotransferase family protein [Rhodocytophaga rosea]QHT67427.1 aminoglycoside phosphotransferase family protein [Rhodocytophaga rosea]